MARSGVAYLLVYLASGGDTDPWGDLGHDPDLRRVPMTWGICRTNVRNWAQEGDDLFFIAKKHSPRDPEELYFLSACFRVAEKIGHARARLRFGPRPNVIVDELPPGPDLRSKVTTYIDRWIDELQWDDGHPDRARLVSGDWTPDEFTVPLDGSVWIHSHWDCHLDWRHRLAAPYLVADPELSTGVAEPIPWSLVTTHASSSLPSAERLTNRSHRHAAQRLKESSDLALLRRIIQTRPRAS